MWRKGNPSALLVGMQPGTTTVENGTEFPLKIKNGTAFWPSDYTSGNIPQDPQTPHTQKIPYVIAVLFTIAKICSLNLNLKLLFAGVRCILFC